MAQIIKGVSPEREAYLKGQQERGITVRGGVSPQRERYLRDAQKPKMSVQEFDSDVIEAKPVNPNRTAMQQRPINSSLGRIGANPVDINTARNVAADMVNNGNYKHPELKPKLQAMFPKPKLALGGIVKANQALNNQQYRQPTSAPFPGFDNMTTDMPTGALQDIEAVKPKRMSIGNALALQDSRDNSFDNMTTDGYKKGGVVKPKLGAMGKTIKGPGTGTSDSIDANLPVGSAIIPASVLKLYGEDFFDKLEAIAEASQPNEEAIEGEYIPANKTTKPTLGMKCGGIAKMKDGGIARNYAPVIQGTGLTSNNIIDNQTMRDDMTAKSQGFYGNINGSSDAMQPGVTEYSIGVGVPDNYEHIPGLNPAKAPLTLKGKSYYDAPSIVPGMDRNQLNEISQGNVSNKSYTQAEDAAFNRQMQGRPVFAKPTEPVSKYKDGGIVPAKVSNKERYMTPQAVKFFGQKFVNTLIHAKPVDVKEEMGEVKGGKVHAKLGDGNVQARINRITGVDNPPVNVRPMSKAAVDMTATEQLRPNIKGNPPSNVKFGQGPFDPNLVYDEKAQTLSEPRNALNKANRSKQVAFTDNAGGVKQLGGGSATQLGAAEFVRQAQSSPLVQKSYGNAQTNLEQQFGRKLPALPGTMNDQTESVMNKTGELMNTKFSDLADKGKRYVNTNYPNAVSDVKNAGDRVVNDFKLGVKGMGNNMLGVNSTQPTAQVKNVALPTTSNQPISKMPFISLPIGENAQPPKLGVSPQPTPMANATPEVPTNSPIGVTQSQQPYSTRLGNMGDNVNTLDVTNRQGGTGRVQFADGRSLMPEQTDYLKGELARNADPAFKERLAKEAETVNQRMAWAKQNDLERNARLGNKAAADTLKAQSDTQQAQLGAQVAANKLGYDRESDAAKLAQEKELKQRELDIQENKPIVTDIRNPEGIVTGQNVLGRTKDKEGKVSYNNLAQNATDKDAEVMQSLSPEERTDMYNNSILTLQDKKIKPNDPKYKASINFLKLHDLLFPQNAVQ